MSVLNKTLKGLEQRTAELVPNSAKQQTVTVPKLTKTSDKVHRFAIALLVLIAIALVAYLALKKQLVPTQTNNKPSVASTPAKPSLERKQAQLVDSQAKVVSTQAEANKAAVQVSSSAAKTVKQIDNKEPKAFALKQVNETKVAQRSAQKTVSDSPPQISKKPVSKPEVETPIVTEKQPKRLTTNSKTKLAQSSAVTAQQQADALFQAGKKAFTFGLIGDAVISLKQCIATLPTHIECRSLLSAAYYGRKDSAKASELLEQGLNIKPNSMQWRTLLAKIYADNKQYEKVLSVLSQRYESDASVDFWIMKGLAAQQLKQHELALRSFKKLTLALPGQSKWWVAMGSSAESLQQWQNAIQFYTTATQIGGLSPTSRRHAIERLKVIREQLDAS